MSTPLTVMLISGAVLISLVVLFLRERVRGGRYANGARTRLDRVVRFVIERTKKELPSINNQFLRELFHYLTHRILSGILSVVRRLEGYVHRIAQFNRMKASEVKSAREKNGTSHLTRIAEHKERAQLSDSEKKRRREQALNGSF